MGGSQLGGLLRAWRKRALLTQEQLAERTGLSERTIRRLESGAIAQPRGASVEVLADALRLTADERSTIIEAAVGRRAAPPHAARVPAQLPFDVGGFAGRQAELATLDDLRTSRPGTLALICGMTGVGKTALAVRWAHQAIGSFTDGQLFADLRGFDPVRTPLDPIDVLRLFLRALGVDAAAMPAELDEAAALYRSLLAGRRVLVVLDNAHDDEQVHPLLPGSSASLVLVTSRRLLVTVLARSGGRLLRLDPLPPSDADGLLRQALAQRADAADDGAVPELSRSCGNLPLAMRVAAAYLVGHPHVSVRQYLTRLSEVAALPDLDRAPAGDPNGVMETEVASAFALSYRALEPAAQRLFRLVSLIPGPTFGLPAAAATTGVATAAAQHLLDRLTSAHLVTTHPGGRYGMHDLVRWFARGCCHRDEPADDVRRATRRLVDFYAHTAYHAYPLLGPRRTESPRDIDHPPPDPLLFDDRATVLAWFDQELDNVLGVLALAGSHSWHASVWNMVNDLFVYFNIRRRWPEWLSALREGRSSAQALGDANAMAHMENSLGVVHKQSGAHRKAHAHYGRALDLAMQSGNSRLIAAIQVNLGGLSISMGDAAAGIRHLRAAIAPGSPQAGNPTAYVNLGCAHIDLDELPEAAEALERALELAVSTDDVVNTCHSHHNLAEIALRRDDRATAQHHARQELKLARDVRDPMRTAAALDILASALLALNPVEARDHWRSARDAYRDLNHRIADVLDEWLRFLDAERDPARVAAADTARRLRIRRLV